jgi:hypothetical protein
MSGGGAQSFPNQEKMRFLCGILVFVGGFLAFCGATPILPTLEFIPLAQHSDVILQAYISATGDLPSKKTYLHLLSKLLFLGSQDFTASELLKYGSQCGVEPTLKVFDDLLMLQLVMPKKHFELGLSMMESLLCRPVLREDRIVVAKAQLSRVPEQITQKLVYPIDWEEDPFTSSTGDLEKCLKDFHAFYFRPENCLLVISGDLEKEKVRESVEFRFKSWFEQPKPAEVTLPTPVKKASAENSNLVAVEWHGPYFRLCDKSCAASLLALFALGVGKGSSLYQVVREKLGYSYFQQAILYPTLKGWVARLWIVRKTEESPDKWTQEVKKELQEQLAAWNENHRKRALGMVAGVLFHEVEANPFWVGFTKLQLHNPLHQATWRGLMRLTSSGSTTPSDLFQWMEAVTLTDLKTKALELLNQLETKVRSL